ncbi:MAG: pyridoxal phosphate-dependent aminotransferase [Isosphaerales bacterium]
MAYVPFSERVSRLRPTAVNRVLQEVRQLQAEGRPLVSLMRGQPDTQTPAHIVEAARKAMRDGRTGYPDNQGEPALRAAVAEKLEREQGLSYSPDREILITDGATLGVYAALGALVDRNRTVLLPDPIYDAYEAPIALWGSTSTPVPATLRDGRFTIGSRQLENTWVTGTDVILLNTPWNPVGTVLNREELDDIMGFAERHDYLVISDEIYESLVYDGRRHVSPASISVDARERTILINSLSKTYAMTGWRVGYCAGPEEIIRAMYLVLQQSSRGPATFVQDAAVCALSSDQECTRQMATEYQGRRNRVIERLCGIPNVEPLVPEGGLFVMVDVRGFGKPSDTVQRFLLREAGVVVLHGSAYGAGGEGFLRISFAAGGETLERGLERLRDGLMRLADEAPPEGEAPSEARF